MPDESHATRSEAPRAQRRLGTAWILFPAVIAVVVVTVILIGWLL
ncbi:MAG: hypothetical protein ABWZ15_11770 [Acidimicrobiia bacterium]